VWATLPRLGVVSESPLRQSRQPLLGDPVQDLPAPSRRVMEGAKRRDEEPAIGARRRAQQPTPRAVKSWWELWRPAAWDVVADAGRIAAPQLVASCECISGTGGPKCITSIATPRPLSRDTVRASGERPWRGRPLRAGVPREHRHSSLRFVTPTQRHRGEDQARLERCKALYEAARTAHPERGSRNIRRGDLIESVSLHPVQVILEGGQKADSKCRMKMRHLP
jgi:hypothetical protein